MAQVSYEGAAYPLLPGETVLDGLLRHGQPIPHACKAGSCGSCLLRASAGEVPVQAQAGLKEAWKLQGYFLACVAIPLEDLTLAPPGDDVRIRARIVDLQALSESVLRVRLRCEAPFHYRAGQYLTLSRDGCSRSYSIASLPAEGHLELHIRLIRGGQMSGWLSSEARVGDEVAVAGPMGECFYVAGQEDQPILLAGAGTGLAPLYGVLQDAIQSRHRGPIWLFHGALRREGLYLHYRLLEMSHWHEGVHYRPVLRDGAGVEDGMLAGELDDVVFQQFPALRGWRTYFCGDPGLVQRMKKRAFLAGAALKQIHVDSFLPSAA
jgi:NAD(P)H-flavin reductase/ferredoxin